ncbi:response regulator receiver domain [Vreelandella titanicae]|uniref:response regulator receiver domain n=1 Tax=Vreelandella titanicae TaxID=664683 RepID=UPI00315B24DD
MSDMEHEVAALTGVNADYSEDWNQHIKRAVSEFLKTAVIMDNQPWVREQNIDRSGQVASNEDTGFDEALPELVVPDSSAEGPTHDLDIRAVSDVFALNGIACAFVLPDDNVAEDQRKIERAVAAAKVSDLVVIDWYLKQQDESLTLNILQEIAKSDTRENGRLRLICVYTGEPLKDSILSDVSCFLKKGGVVTENVDKEEYCAVGEHTLVVIKNKTITPADQLPSDLISLFSHFAEGLIPAFSLAAVGAIRKNAHHMLTRFGKWLDSAYIANRLITDPPGDVSEMLRDLFISECDAALGLEAVADRYLETIPISFWLSNNKNSIGGQTHKKLDINGDLLLEILRNGVKDQKSFNGDTDDINIPQNSRNLISAALAGSLEASKKSEHEFARLVALKREAFGRSKLIGDENWKPTLTTGTLIKVKLKDAVVDEHDETIPEIFEYLICLTPACDTLRLNEITPFVFLRAKIEDRRYGIVLREKNGEEVCLRIDAKNPVLKTFFFAPDEEFQRVFAIKDEDSDFKFLDSDDQDFLWLGEVRYTRAASEMAGLVRNWMRIGISDSEYLRLTSEGKF